MNNIIYNIFKEDLLLIKQKNPMVHHITNFVTMQDCANICVAFGASPVMAFYSGEVSEISAVSNSLVLNTGTPDIERIKSIILAGKEANKKDIPVVLDPVGAGVSQFRRESIKNIIENIKPSIIKGNSAEIKMLSGYMPKMNKGVDSVENFDRNDKDIAKTLAKNIGAVIAVTGIEDYITDGERELTISRGSNFLKTISGSGCMTSTLTGSFAAIEEDMFLACVFGILTMDLAGEIAEKRLLENEGAGMFKVRLFDAIYNMYRYDFKEGIEFGF